MSQPAKAQEPSMEEILASIRRIIADDDTAKPAAAKPAPPPAAARAAAAPRCHAAAPSIAARRRRRPPRRSHGTARHRCDAGGARRAAGRGRGSRGRRARPDRTDGGNRRGRDAELPDHRWAGGCVLRRRASAAGARRRAWPNSRRRQPAPQPSMPDRTIMSSTTSAAVDSAFNALAQTVLVQNARTLEDLVREMLRPLLSPGSTTTCRAWSSASSRPRSNGSRAGAADRSV